MKYYILVAVSILLIACNDNDPFEQFEVLTRAEWELNTIQENGIEIIQPCEQDDLLRFIDASNFEYDENLLVCPLGGQVTEIQATNWKMIDNNTTIMLNFRYDMVGGGAILGTQRWRILELNDSLLRLQDAHNNGTNPVLIREYSR